MNTSEQTTSSKKAPALSRKQKRSRQRGRENVGKTFNAFAEEQRPQPTWRSLKLGRNPVALLQIVLSIPLIRLALHRIDSYGADGRTFPLSTVVRWLFMMPLCHIRVLEHMADRMLTDDAVKWAVLGDPAKLGKKKQDGTPDGTPPTRSYISKQIGYHLDMLIELLERLYDSLVAALLRFDPLLKYGLVFDASMVNTLGSPEHEEYERDKSGRWRKTGKMIPATDPDAARWARRIHSTSGQPGSSSEKRKDELKKHGFGYRMNALIFCRRPIPVILPWLVAPRKGQGEILNATRMLAAAQEKFGSLLEFRNDELAIFLADTGLASKEFFEYVRRRCYEPIIPYKRTQTENILDKTKLVTRKGSNSLELDVRWDGTPLCPGEWDKSNYKGGRRPLEPLPSDITNRAQRWRCPMNAVGECPSPCGLEPHYKDPNLPINTIYPRVKKTIKSLSPSDGFHYVLFPRIGAEAQTLSSFRGRIEHDFGYIKGRGCFGGDSEARLPIRGQKRLKLRLLCTLIPLVALAMYELGVPMPAELLDDWFCEIDDASAEAAA